MSDTRHLAIAYKRGYQPTEPPIAHLSGQAMREYTGPLPADAPVPSPHPLFGRRPGRLARLFADFESETFWPTNRQAWEYKRYRESCSDNPIMCSGRPEYPMASQEQARRWEVYEFVQSRRDDVDQREWWERL